ncbi:J domain-containing protein [Dactylococcopsis salina]|uniref:DnaJ-class molecular chaperone with C-terminal Zn finger domain n=1 Tax=Dactylococcopsis salina (strain PCC 8305) TaxID=13035 RepID=K9YTA9_DACS8|nr:J domain-containing protein [Dactylococcopsis salina]AFZ49600.1 DnaJ-class molecular chaperone with C-terminal Zn finger domain [Dactylococcopsis salina PCC 8305]
MATATLTPEVKQEINRLSQEKLIDHEVLEEFAEFVIKINHKSASKVKNKLNISDLKEAVYQRFKVKNTKELKQSNHFQMATDGMEKLDFRLKVTWEKLYRKFIGILPNEMNQEGYGCINGINVFQYFKPWQVFNLDPKTATKNEIKKAYYQLSKVYHPDNQKTGNREIFEQIELMYKSIIAGV